MIKLDSVLRIKFKATIQCTLKSSPPPPQNMLPVVLSYSIVECRIEFFANPTIDMSDLAEHCEAAFQLFQEGGTLNVPSAMLPAPSC